MRPTLPADLPEHAKTEGSLARMLPRCRKHDRADLLGKEDHGVEMMDRT